MKGDPHIDISKSILKCKLITYSKYNIFYFIDLILFIIPSLIIALCLLLAGFESIKNPGIPDKVFSVVLFLISLIIGYSIHRKITQEKLFIIKHSLTKTKIKNIILELFKDVEDKNIIETVNCLVITKSFSYYSKEYTFILDANRIYYNIANHYPKVDPPVIIDHIFLKDQITKLIGS